jgi:uncharacterized protein YodC (DUF2158 family)
MMERDTMSHDFKEGDTVELKTGDGPAMVYVGEDQLGEAIYVWMERSNKRQETFPFVALRKKTSSSGTASIVRG